MSITPLLAPSAQSVRLAGRRRLVALTLGVAIVLGAAGSRRAIAARAVQAPDVNAPLRAARRAAGAENTRLSEQTGQRVVGASTRGAAAGQPPAASAAPRSGPDAAAEPLRPVTVPEAGAVAIPPVTREVYSYEGNGRRDPFFSLILTEDLRPLLSDLRLVGILYAPSGGRSVAIMRDVNTAAQYRVNTGATLGRMRVAQIKQRAVIFNIDEFGMSRQDSLVLTDTTKVRN